MVTRVAPVKHDSSFPLAPPGSLLEGRALAGCLLSSPDAQVPSARPTGPVPRPWGTGLC